MDYFTEGFCVRERSWHGKETLVMDDLILPRDRERAMVLACHDFVVRECQSATLGSDAGPLDWKIDDGWKSLVSSKTGRTLNKVKKSYTVIQNGVGWDVLEAIVGEGARLDTGMVLHDGGVCLVTAFLDEPARITGDDSLILPYIVTRWAHDGSGALSARYTSVRVVCANTDEMSRIEARRTGREYTFRHTKNVHERIEDAKLALQGIRLAHDEYVELSEELAATPISKEQRDAFVNMLLPTPPEALVSDRVARNVDEARAAVQGLFYGPTIPNDHKFTAYGLRLAGVEYLDHLRGYRSQDTYVGRQLLRVEPAKAKLGALIREVVKA